MAFSRGINAHEMVRAFLQHSPKMTRAGKAQCYYDPSTKAIYSYGPHYRVAWHHRCLDGSDHVLVNSQYYSQCTTAHVSGVMRALNSLMVRWIEVDLTYFDHTIQRSNRLDLITSAGASAQQAASDREWNRKRVANAQRDLRRRLSRDHVIRLLDRPDLETASHAVIDVLLRWSFRRDEVKNVLANTPELLQNSRKLDAVLRTIHELQHGGTSSPT